jgi:hypothetical protein
MRSPSTDVRLIVCDHENIEQVARKGATAAADMQLPMMLCVTIHSNGVQAMQLEVARRAFIRIRDVRYVELVNRTEAGRKAGIAEGLLMAEIYGESSRQVPVVQQPALPCMCDAMCERRRSLPSMHAASAASISPLCCSSCKSIHFISKCPCAVVRSSRRPASNGV